MKSKTLVAVQLFQQVTYSGEEIARVLKDFGLRPEEIRAILEKLAETLPETGRAET